MSSKTTLEGQHFVGWPNHDLQKPGHRPSREKPPRRLVTTWHGNGGARGGGCGVGVVQGKDQAVSADVGGGLLEDAESDPRQHDPPVHPSGLSEDFRHGILFEV